MISRNIRAFATKALLGCATLPLPPLGCGGGLDQVISRQDPSSERPHVPDSTVERLKACVRENGRQLAKGSHTFHPVVRVDREGYRLEVTTDDIPRTAPDFAACTRVALGDMKVPEELLNHRPVRRAHETNGPTAAQRSMVGSPVIVVIVVEVALVELILEAGAYTILFATTVEAVDRAAKDVADFAKRRRQKKDKCTDHYEECIGSDLARDEGRHIRDTRCAACASVCVDNNGEWPSQVGSGSCNYWVN